MKKRSAEAWTSFYILWLSSFDPQISSKFSSENENLYKKNCNAIGSGFS